MPKVKQAYIHITDVQRFKRCRRLWGYASPLKSNLVPTERYAPYYFGTLVHYVLEQVAKGYSFPVALDSFFVQNEGKVPASPLDTGYSDYQLAKGIFRHYLMWQKTLFITLNRDEDYEHISPEHSFTYLLHGNAYRRIYLKGKFDGIVRHKGTGKYYLWEIKTTRSVTERLKQLDLEQQTDAYLIAAQHVLNSLGIYEPVEGMIYTLIRKKVPPDPKVLKDGTLSQAKLDTTPYWYAMQVKQQHPDYSTEQLSSIYGPALSQLQAEHTPYFERLTVTRSVQQLVQSQRDLIAVAQDMVSPRTMLYPNPDDRCNYCLFRDPCVLQQQGLKRKAEALLQSNFKLNNDYEGEQLDG